MNAARKPEGARWLESSAAWLAFAVPVVLGLLRSEGQSAWTGDLGMVRVLGLEPIGGEGVVTSILGQLVVVLPLGGRWLRVAMLGAVATGFASLALFEIVRRLLRANATTPVLSVALALAASATSTLTPAWQVAASKVGSGAVAVALGLGVLAVATVAMVPEGTGAADVRRWFLVGLLGALTPFECRWVAVELAVGAVAALAAHAGYPHRGALVACSAGAVGAALVALGLVVGRAASPNTSLDLGAVLATTGGWRLGLNDQPVGGFAAWQGEVGLVPVVVAGFGLLWGLWCRKTRPVVVAFGVFLLADVVVTRFDPVALTDPRTPLRLGAVAAVAALGGLGVQTAVVGLKRAKLPFARAAALLLVVLDFTFALAAAEDASFSEPDREAEATEIWTDEAFGGLPTRAVVLVRQEAVAYRLRAAALVRGERPDLVVVPMASLDQRGTARRLLQEEPAFAGLLRDVAMQGQPGEYSMSTLADGRPLYVEVDPAWDPRMFAHLSPGAMWLRFSPHAVGRSDRVLGVKAAMRSIERVLAATEGAGQVATAPTRHVASRSIREQAAVLLFLGDHGSAAGLLEPLRSDVATDPLAAAIAARAAGRCKGPVDIAALVP
ncbi:MAG: hypothetical protein JW751_08220 [Polyangiaceae bacterium]|nr:hypothetical protein [Polyangiaceae bacterium]